MAKVYMPLLSCVDSTEEGCFDSLITESAKHRHWGDKAMRLKSRTKCTGDIESVDESREFLAAPDISLDQLAASAETPRYSELVGLINNTGMEIRNVSFAYMPAGENWQQPIFLSKLVKPKKKVEIDVRHLKTAIYLWGFKYSVGRGRPQYHWALSDDDRTPFYFSWKLWLDVRTNFTVEIEMLLEKIDQFDFG